MPQLDLTIIFPQIFWLCVIFSFFYFILTFYLLPKFLISLKLRQFILEENSKKVISVTSLLLDSKTSPKSTLAIKFQTLATNFENIEFIFQNKDLFSNSKIDSKIADATLNTILFSDSTILNNIKFYPKSFWIKS